MIARRLARFRVPLGFVSGVIVLWLARPTPMTLGIGIPVAIAGEMLRLWAAGHLNKSREVTMSGPYRWFAHPLYVGSSIMAAGLAIASGRAAVAALIVVYLAATLTAAITSEEAFLRQTFGDRYERYRAGRPTSGADAGRRFSFAQARANHEPRTIAGVIAAVLLLILKAAYNGAFWRAAAGP